MTNKLSHSASNQFMDCPTKWKYHYVDRLRSKTQHAALAFGSAVDAAFTSILKDKDKKPEDVFAYFWRFQEINGKETYLPTATNIVYANSDYDEELLQPEDIRKLAEEFKIELPLQEVNKVYEEKEYAGFDNLPEDRKRLLNYANWLSLYRKGLLMIDAMREEVLPKIKKLHGTQVYCKLENDVGDLVVGYADMVAEWEGYDEPIVFDFKTSAKDYAVDSVLTSPQLTLYVHSLSSNYNNTRRAGYIVFNKNIRKNKTKVCRQCDYLNEGTSHKTCNNVVNGTRCNGEWNVKINPKVYVQVVIDSIPEKTEEIVLENFDYINASIKNGVFHRNLQNCVKSYGKCQYYNYCYKDDMSGLIKLEDENNRNKK